MVSTGFWALPAAVVVAVTRYRLFDIDRIISRTVAYTPVAGTVGAIHVATVVGLQALVAGAFTERVRREVDVDAIVGALSVAVGQSVQSAEVRLWLRARAHVGGAQHPPGADG